MVLETLYKLQKFPSLQKNLKLIYYGRKAKAAASHKKYGVSEVCNGGNRITAGYGFGGNGS